MISNSTLFIILAAVLIVLIAVVLMLFVRRKKNAVQAGGYINEQVYVGNLPYRIGEDDLREYFSRFGNIQSVRVIRNFKTGRSRGYAFVTYFSPDQANDALSAHGRDIHGRSMVVRIAKPRQA